MMMIFIVVITITAIAAYYVENQPKEKKYSAFKQLGRLTLFISHRGK